MSTSNAEVLADLARVKAFFQLRAITAVIGASSLTRGAQASHNHTDTPAEHRASSGMQN